MKRIIPQAQMSGFICNSHSLYSKVAAIAELLNKSTVLLVRARIIMELHAFLALPPREILLPPLFASSPRGFAFFAACSRGNFSFNFSSLTWRTNFLFNFALQLPKT